jgi:2-methylcitrate dehydratase PrpD
MSSGLSASNRLIKIMTADCAITRDRAVDYWHRFRGVVASRVAANDVFVQQLRAVVDVDAILGPCSIEGFDGGYAARDAAFVSGALLAAQWPLPIAAVVATVAALSQEAGGDDAVAVAAIAGGLEALQRLERAAGIGMHARGHLVDGLLGVPAATAAAGLTLALSPAAMADALGVAGSLASGSREWRGMDSKLLGGWMARSAILAVRLAQAGFSGPAEVFEGRKGLFNAYAGAGNYSLASLFSDAESELSHAQEHS